MNARSDKQIAAQEILQSSHSSCNSTKSRRPPHVVDGDTNTAYDTPPCKPDSKLELPRPVTSANNEGLSELGPINRKALRLVAILCLFATCWNIGRFATVLWEIDGTPTHVQVSGTLEYVPKEMREAGNVPWWKVARVKLEVEVDVDDPDVTTSPTGLGEKDPNGGAKKKLAP